MATLDLARWSEVLLEYLGPMGERDGQRDFGDHAFRELLELLVRVQVEVFQQSITFPGVPGGIERPEKPHELADLHPAIHVMLLWNVAHLPPDLQAPSSAVQAQHGGLARRWRILLRH